MERLPEAMITRMQDVARRHGLQIDLRLGGDALWECAIVRLANGRGASWTAAGAALAWTTAEQGLLALQQEFDLALA